MVGLLLAWIGHSIESFALRTVATLLPSVRCETHSRARDLQPSKPWCLTAGFNLGGGQLRNQTVVDRNAVPDVRDGSVAVLLGFASVSTVRAPGHCWGSLGAWVGRQMARAPGWISANRVVDSPTTSPSSW
jgi:hypothetical protein